MDIIEELKRIAGATPQELTQADKAFIKEQAKAQGVAFNPHSACKSCYIDCAVVIYRALKDAETRAELAEATTATATPAPLWRLKEGVDVVWRGIRINSATITDAKAEQYVKSGFPTKYFV